MNYPWLAEAEAAFAKRLETGRLAHALLRGRYMRAVAAMEYRGIPIDMEIYNRLFEAWEPLKADVNTSSPAVFCEPRASAASDPK